VHKIYDVNSEADILFVDYEKALYRIRPTFTK